MMTAARRQQKSDAYTALITGVDAGDVKHQALELLTTKEVKAVIGGKADGLSNTFIGNMQRKLVRKMQHEELQSVADWVLSLITSQYPNAEVDIKRGRIVQVWLDGKPEVVE